MDANKVHRPSHERRSSSSAPSSHKIFVKVFVSRGCEIVRLNIVTVAVVKINGVDGPAFDVTQSILDAV
jgi:hypothetical protein